MTAQALNEARAPRSRSEQQGSFAASFNHLIGSGEERRRDREAERSGCLEVDYELEFGRLQDRHVSRLLASKHSPCLQASLIIGVKEARSIAHQTTHLRKLANVINRGQAVMLCHRDKPFPVTVEKRFGLNNEGL